MSTQELTSTNHAQQLSISSEKDQYTLRQILGIWLAGDAPMWILSWLVYPALTQGLSAVDAGPLLLKIMIIGLIWEFVLVMIILYREEGNIRIGTIRRRFWLNNPVSPKTGKKDNRLWWMLIPLMLLVTALELGFAPFIDGIWTKLLPFLAEPQSHSMEALFAPELRARWIGAWDLFVIFVVSSVFNNFLSEEFLFRGLLLPKMKGVFGKWDWVANGVAFGMYHLHMPWSVPGNIVFGWVMAFTGKRYHSNWFPIILHSGQGFFFGILILDLVLGLA
jgi:uncharacterized protein